MKNWKMFGTVAIAALAIGTGGCKKAEAPKTDPKKVEVKKEEPKKVEPKKEEPKKEEVKKEEPKKEAPKKEEAKKEEPKKEEPKKEAPKAAVTNAEFVTKFMAAMDAGTLTADFYTADAEINHIGDPAGPQKGWDKISAHMTEWRKGFSESKHAASRIFDGGNVVIVQAVGTAKNTGEFMKKPATGKMTGSEAGIVMWLDGGKVKKADIYTDFTAMLSQLGAIKDMPAHPIPALPTNPAEVIKSTTDQARLDMYKAGMEAHDKGDITFFEKNVDANVKMIDHTKPAPVVGFEAWKKDFQEMHAAMEGLKCTTTNVWIFGEYTVATFTFEAKFKGDPAENPMAGKSFKADALHILQFKGGKAVLDEAYMNPIQVLAATGMLEKMMGGGDQPAPAPGGDKPTPAGDKPAPAGDKPAPGHEGHNH